MYAETKSTRAPKSHDCDAQVSPSFHPLGIVTICGALAVDAAIVNMQVKPMSSGRLESMTCAEDHPVVSKSVPRRDAVIGCRGDGVGAVGRSSGHFEHE
jgi:hypothetical protein